MHRQTALQKILHFFLTKIIIGIAVIVALVALIESLRGFLSAKKIFSENGLSVLAAIAEVIVVTAAYIILFRKYENRKIKELSISSFGANALKGLVTGASLQSLFILVIYITGNYAIVHVNPVSNLIPAFTFALTAGFVAEILITGIAFRLAEEKAGSFITLGIFILLFAILHVNSKGASWLSVCATAAQAGFMLPASYIYSRSLWLPIFLHLSWDFMEPGIFGAINSSTSVSDGLFTAHISGPSLFTGGLPGPQNSLQSLILCLLTGIIFLWLAKRRNNLVTAAWQMKNEKELPAVS